MAKGKKEDNVDDIGKDETIRRLKLLSVSQTAFLKDYIGKKLKSTQGLVNAALIALKNEGASADLINSLADLDIDSLTSVDVKSVQLMMHEEMALLRASLEGDSGAPFSALPSASSSPQSPGVASVASMEAISKLEAENANLRGLLKEVKEELVLSSKAQSNSEGEGSKIIDLTHQLSSAKLNAETQESSLRKELSGLTLSSEKARGELEAALSEAQSELAASKAAHAVLEAELGALKKAQEGTSAVTEELASAKAQVVILSEKLAAATKEIAESIAALTKQAQDHEEKARVLAAENEAEKDEMMSAMAQELEETEATHAAALQDLATENKKLTKSVSKYKSTSKVLTTGLVPVKKSIASLSAAQKSLSDTIREQMQVTLKEVSAHFGSSLLRKLRDTDQRVVDMAVKWKREMSERKRLHNLVQELKGNIRVFMRCRPPSTREIEQFGGNESVCVSEAGPGEVKVFNEKGREKIWEFDEIFHIDSTQEQVYAQVSDLIVSVLDGFNVCIFAYGQTGSGKTYTMTGSGDSQGVNIRALADLFEKAEVRSSEWVDSIEVSVLEVYNEAINDLLVTGGGDKLEVKQGAKGNHVPGLTQVPVTNLDEVTKLLLVADKNRSQASTNMNEHSSRSHMMMTVSISSEHKETRVVSRGKLNLVDLAGSERLDKSGATGMALKEAQNINKSLSALGDVIAARAMKQGHIPFRNSTLTYLLQDSLSQDSKTLMFVCVSPVIYNAEETFCSLNFASRVRSVELGKATKNVSGPGAKGAPVAKKAPGAR